MANRYWLGGNWNNTANWSATNNGAGGASIPTTVDSVFWHTVPLSATYTVDVGAFCLDMDWTGATNSPTLAGTFALSVYGSLTLISAMTMTYSGLFDMLATSTGKTITTAGKSLSSSIVFEGVGGGWTLQDSIITTGSIVHNRGALDTNGKAINALGFDSNSGFTRTLSLGASVITLTSDWWSPTVTGLTFNAGTSTIILTSNTGTFGGGGLTFNNVTFSGTNTTIQSSNTFNVWTINAGKIVSITSGTTQTIANIVSNGVKGNRGTIKSVTAASAATISVATTVSSASHMTIQDITKTGLGTLTFRKTLNVSGNTNISFLDRYWINGTGNINDTSHWAYVSGGTGGASNPTGADSIYFDSASFTGASQTVTINAAFQCLDMDWTGATNTPTFTGSFSPNIFGSITYILAMVCSINGSTIMLSGLAGNTITTNGLSLTGGGEIQFNGLGGTWTLQDNLTLLGTITHLKGTLDTNGKTVTCQQFNSTGTNTRVLTLGASTINPSSFITFASTGLTLNIGTSTINVSGSTTFAGGGMTFNIVNFTGTTVTVTGSSTFATLNVAAGKTLILTSGTTQTITIMTANGTTSLVTIKSSSAGSPATISKSSGAVRLLGVSLKDITGTGGAVFNAFAGSLDVSGNTGWVFIKLIGQFKLSGSYTGLFWQDSTGTVVKISG